LLQEDKKAIVSSKTNEIRYVIIYIKLGKLEISITATYEEGWYMN